MGRDRKKSNSNNDVEEKVSPKKSTAKGGKNGERKDEAPAKANAKGMDCFYRNAIVWIQSLIMSNILCN
jgi:hypothetical protein